jgi:hypothetical protein
LTCLLTCLLTRPADPPVDPPADLPAVLPQLNLASNDIGGYYEDECHLVSTPEGADALAEALLANSSLTSLGLELNRLGTDGARALAPAIAANSALASVRS